MDWLDFVSSLIRSMLGWPVAVVMVAWILRAELKGLLGRLETIRHKESEASFALEVGRITERVTLSVTDEDLPGNTHPDTEQTPTYKPATSENPSPVRSEVEELEKLVFESRKGSTLARSLALKLNDPGEVILMSWHHLEDTMRRSFVVDGIDSAPLNKLLGYLRSQKAITAADTESIMSLNYLRERVAAGEVPSAVVSLEYARVIDLYLTKLFNFLPGR